MLLGRKLADYSQQIALKLAQFYTIRMLSMI